MCDLTEPDLTQTLGVAKVGPSRQRLMSTIQTACFEVLTGVPFKDATADGAAPVVLSTGR